MVYDPVAILANKSMPMSKTAKKQNAKSLAPKPVAKKATKKVVKKAAPVKRKGK
jgi:hypothetical protein